MDEVSIEYSDSPEAPFGSRNYPIEKIGDRYRRSASAGISGALSLDPLRRLISKLSLKRHSKYSFGVFLIVCVAFIWVAASQWIQYIFGNLQYSKPYFLTFFNTFGFSFWNFGYLFSGKWRKRFSSALFQRGESKSTSKKETIVSAETASFEQTATEYSMTKLLIATCLFCPLWFIANTLFNYSLSCVSVSTNTILSSSSSVWTLFLSYLMFQQNIKPMHIIAVAFSVSGSILVGIASSSPKAPASSVIGIFATVLSAAFYAGYTTALKKMLPDEEKYSMSMVFGILGVVNTVVFWPGFVILHMTGLEVFEIPPRHTLWPLAVNALIGTNLSDVLWAKGVVLTSPLVATLGLSLTIPMAMILDIFLKSHSFSFMYISGAIVVTAGFTLCNLQ
uniref:EamA domain-containing protein n=1 Tax=Paramoeba aestuarina TaxID=180227 RepID=A0A7S4PCB2_9EUKA|mmetsp:Transcript_40040/g.63302  ORF Transcript_40040/g.63302 Transcript_40040/m.63302 type:complete len:392 (+) Transcript_40040:33-1208(+)